ncbi:beta strand repeat-containing protein, partial [Flavobacterium turcicum]|uniref:beta strand repeat-containing protein n=1 Tax=Flavobacterium turcicum TaxID=2764718 RepID=UPI003743ECB3|nr:hypothetical protein [Flavobacterium turcicum]
GLTLNADGTITVNPNTASGTYTVVYEICEVGATPVNCKQATATVVVNNPIVAVMDGPTTVATAAAPIIVQNVTANDTLNGVVVTAANTDVTPVTAGPLSIDANGVLTLAANTASGTYTITYQLCEVGASPANCDTATATVLVANVIDAINNTAVTVASSNTVITALNALDNDIFNGVAATTINTNITALTTGPLSINADGIVSVAANTPSGTYTITYQLCEADPLTGLNVSPSNCDTATATVVVSNLIDAVNDPSVTITSSNTVVTALNVLDNDTVNGIPANINNTNVTPVSAGPLSVDATGLVTVAANTASGTYSITYQLCEADPVTGLNLNPANCDNATATVVVLNEIVAVNDGPTTVASDNVATVVQNVTTNDTLNGVIVTGTNTNVTPITTGPLSIDVNGVLTLAPNTASGTYAITYQLCEEGASPANCATATATVIVSNPLIAVNDGPITVATAEVPKIVLNVTTNDTLYGDLVTDSNTNVTPSTVGPLSIGSNGEVTLAPNTPSGTYVLPYEICEVGAVPANCKTASATVVVLNVIVANTDETGGLAGATTGSVLGNDTFSGIPPIKPGDVILTTTIANPALTLNPDGTITIAVGTPAGPQTLQYQICEIGSTPPNCSTASVTVNVQEAAVDAIADDYTATPFTGGNGGVTASVLNNDTLNGVVLNPSAVILTLSGTAPTGFVLNSDGTITVPAGQVSGTYNVFYQICERINPTNCDIANAKIRISNEIIASNDTFPTQVPSTTIATTVGNVLGNNGNGSDNLNGNPVTVANTDVTPITTGPLSIDANGNLTLAPNTVSGTYTIIYQLCETGADPINCTTATATVVVLNPINAIDDAPAVVNTGVNSKVILDVTANDTLNGVIVTPANSNVTPVTQGPLSIDENGIVTLAGNTPSGTYTIVYQICEVNPSNGLEVNPSNCDTATATVVVLNPVDAVNDPAVTIASNNSTAVALNALTNDTFNGVAATTVNTNVTPLTTGPLSIDANGIVSVAANTASGTYEITYQLCEADPITGANVTPANCDTATARVVVANVIDAVNDPAVTIASSNNVVIALNALANDTLNGVMVTTANTNVTASTSGPLSIDVDGNVTVAPNTVSGTYIIVYQLCEADSITGLNANPSNCDTATATVVVVNAIEAVNDSFNTSSPLVSTVLGSVLGNDTVNGQVATIGNTNVTPATNGPLSIDVDGNVTVAPNTPSGTYTLTY